MNIDVKDLEFSRALMLSTAHMTEDDVDLLDEEGRRSDENLPANTFVVQNYPEGYWIYIPPAGPEFDDTFQKAKKWYSSKFMRLLWLIEDVRDLGEEVTHLRLDCDGPTVKALNPESW